MLAFDWNLKDINNLKHPPEREITPAVMWFYINLLYFPYNAQHRALERFEDFFKPTRKALDQINYL